VNNSFLQEMFEDAVVADTTVILRERKEELTKIVEAINHLAQTADWQLLKDRVFDGQVEKIKKNLQLESEKSELQPTKIYRLQGELEWAKRYSDLYKLAETYKVEINNITKKLNDYDSSGTSRQNF